MSMHPLVIGTAELAVLERIQRKVLGLSTWMVHHANFVRPSADGTGSAATRPLRPPS